MHQRSYSSKHFMFVLIALASISVSCKKYIDQAPINSTYSAEFWTSQTSVEQAALAMYGQLRSSLRANNTFFINGDLTTGTFMPNSTQWNLVTIQPYNTPPFDFKDVDYVNELQDWTRFYQLIAQANLILQNVPQMPNSLFQSMDVKNNYLGEALFMRAFTYFYITRIWGDPVYVSKTYNGSDYGNIAPLARTAETLVLDSCIRDLKQAAGYMTFAGGDPSKSVRANKGSVCALLAHIYAWQHQYDSAHVYCLQVINQGGYALEPMSSYKNIWKGQQSQESIFELAMTYNGNDPNFISQGNWAEATFGFFDTFLKGPLVDNQSDVCWLAPIGGIADDDYTLYDTVKDARFGTIFTHMDASGGDAEGYMMTKYANFAFQSPGSQPNTGTGPYINADLVLFRLSDIILLDAEALDMKGNLSGAMNDLALTEGRAGINSYKNPTDQTGMMDEIVAERGREFIGEGEWFYDLIRTEQFYTQGGIETGWLEYVGYPSNRLTPANKGYYWPLNMGTLFPQDNLLTQNPWWASNN